MKTGQKDTKLARIVQHRNEDFTKSLKNMFGVVGTRACRAVYRAFAGPIDIDDMPLEYVMAYCHPEAIKCVRNCGVASQELVGYVRELYLRGKHGDMIRNTEDLQQMLMDIGGLSPLSAANVALELMWNYHIMTEDEFLSGVAGIILASDPHVSPMVLERLEEVYPIILKHGSLYSEPITLVIQHPDGTRFSYVRTSKHQAKDIIGYESRANNWTAGKGGMYKKTSIMLCLMKENKEEKDGAL